jgi:hypothetical protein
MRFAIRLKGDLGPPLRAHCWIYTKPEKVTPCVVILVRRPVLLIVNSILSRTIYGVLSLAAIFCLVYQAIGQLSSNASVEETLSLLNKLAAEEIASEDSFLAKTRFAVDSRANIVLYDMTPAPIGMVLSDSDPLSIPMEAMIRTEALRRDLQKSVPTETFWIAPLANVQGSIKKCVDSLVHLKDKSGLQQKEDDCSAGIAGQINYLDQSMQTFARDRRLTLTQRSVERAPVIGYKVRVSIEPARARVKFMTLLEYKKCISSHSPLTDQWNDMPEGDLKLIGRYHYLADWPPELNGPEEGNFEIREPGAITFRPSVRH